MVTPARDALQIRSLYSNKSAKQFIYYKLINLFYYEFAYFTFEKGCPLSSFSSVPVVVNVPLILSVLEY